MNRSKVTSTPALAWFALFASVFLLFVALDSRADDAATEDGDVIVIGAQDTDVDADENRDAKFEKNREFHDGIVLDYFQWSRRSETGWFQIQGLGREPA